MIIHLDVFKDFYFCFIPGLKLVPMDKFNLERMNKTLCDGIVPAVAFFAPAPNELVLS